jgi:tetratricopeptide (TPR) repeat protein
MPACVKRPAGTGRAAWQEQAAALRKSCIGGGEPVLECPNCGAENPEGARFCHQCGAILQPTDQAIDRMIEDYRREVDKNPSDAMARYNLGLAYRYKGMDDLAEMEWKRVRQLAPEFADVHYQLALLHRKRGNRDLARQSAEAALVAEPEHPRAKRLLGELSREG